MNNYTCLCRMPFVLIIFIFSPQMLNAFGPDGGDHNVYLDSLELLSGGQVKVKGHIQGSAFVFLKWGDNHGGGVSWGAPDAWDHPDTPLLLGFINQATFEYDLPYSNETEFYVLAYAWDDNVQRTAVLSIKNITLTSDHELWWFNGENPGGGYYVAASLSAPSLATGTFKWDVTSGASIVDLNNGGADTDSITATNDSTVAVKSTASSASKFDVTIKLTYNGSSIYTFRLFVRAPNLAVHINPDGHVAHGVGYLSTIKYNIYDQFTDILPSNVTWNEDIDGDGEESDGATVSAAAITVLGNENWGWNPEEGWEVEPDDASDSVGRAGSSLPTSQNPQTPLGSTEIDHSPSGGGFYVGSATPGKGIKVVNVVWHIYRDHARHN